MKRENSGRRLPVGITEEVLREMSDMYKVGYSYRQIGEKFNVTLGTASYRIKLYRNLTDESRQRLWGER